MISSLLQPCQPIMKRLYLLQQNVLISEFPFCNLLVSQIRISTSFHYNFPIVTIFAIVCWNGKLYLSYLSPISTRTRNAPGIVRLLRRHQSLAERMNTIVSEDHCSTLLWMRTRVST